MSSEYTFYAETVLFDMDGTLTDSIQAVEAAWGKVANDIGQDPVVVIAATLGRRAIDNLAQLKPDIPEHAMDEEVQKFEESILYFADAYNRHGPGAHPPESLNPPSNSSSNASTPSLSPPSTPSSRTSSIASFDARRPSFGAQLESGLRVAATAPVVDLNRSVFDESAVELPSQDMLAKKKTFYDELEAWQIETASVDHSVRILPGVKKMIESIPNGHWAVATSSAKTYGLFNPRKPAPDPFLLAAKCFGYDIKNCVAFEDSPSGIRAGLASDATVVAVCTNHEREKIEGLGAHYIVENMDYVKCEVDQESSRLKLTVWV
uniref:Putative HAD-like protein n=1 Tax=Moniliophthora roreri TaxID=221103 RepID=A0A0W0GDY0_MONRR